MQAEIISIGTELLLGNIVDTNAAHIARALAAYGVDLFHKSTVGDNLDRCAETISRALARADAVIISGGIGPTPDDATRAAIAQALGVPLERRPELVEVIRARYARRHREPTEAGLRQADMPVGAQAIPNPNGTAPGILAAKNGTALYAMPGVPSEMVAMLADSVLPDLRQRFGLVDGLFCRLLRTRGIGESDIATQLHDLLTDCVNPTVATYVKTGEVEVRITARAPDMPMAETMIEPLETLVRERIGSHIFGVDAAGLEQQLGQRLRHLGLKLATAESCTGGLVGERITSVAGSSEYYLGGVVAYDNQVKMDLLNVPPGLLAQYGAVSEECAREMARGAAERLGADWAVATTGIAGPDGGTAEKPVGLVFIAVYDRTSDVATVVEKRFSGDRAMVKERTALEALEQVLQRLAGSKQ